MPSPEIIEAQQAVTDAKSAAASKKQEVEDSLNQKNAQISTLQSDIVTKDARILELENQVGSGIPPADVSALTSSIQGLTGDIASIPTS